jgi:HB1, ASXL, restriction endonuclease HTH domain
LRNPLKSLRKGEKMNMESIVALTKPQMQAIVDQIIERSGAAILKERSAETEQLLGQHGMTLEDLTERQIINSIAKHKRKLMKLASEAPLDENTLTWLPPQSSSNGVSTFDTWTTKCGRFRISRITGPEPRFMSIKKINALGATEREIKNDMRTLRAAIGSIESLPECKGMASNSETIISQAEKDGNSKLTPSTYQDPKQGERLQRLKEIKRDDLALHTPIGPVEVVETVREELPDGGPVVEEKQEENSFRITEEQARKLLEDTGRKSVGKWPLDKIVKMLNRPQHLTDGGTELVGDSLNLFKALSSAVQEGRKVVLEESAEQVFGEVKNLIIELELSKKIKKRGPSSSTGTMSGLDAAHKVLVDTGKTLSAKELVEQMRERSLWTSSASTPVDTIKAHIYEEIKKKGAESRFVKVGPGQFSAK